MMNSKIKEFTIRPLQDESRFGKAYFYLCVGVEIANKGAYNPQFKINLIVVKIVLKREKGVWEELKNEKTNADFLQERSIGGHKRLGKTMNTNSQMNQKLIEMVK